MNNLSAVKAAQLQVAEARTKIEAIKNRLETEELAENEFRKLKSEYAQAQDDLEFAELREKSANERAKQQAANERRENLLLLQSDLSKLGDVSELDKLLKKVSKSVDEYFSAANARANKISEIREAIQSGGFLDGATPGQIENIPTIIERNLTKIGAVEVNAFSIKSKLDQAIDEIITAHFPRGLY